MTTRAAILWIVGVAAILLTALTPIQASGHSILELMDRSIILHNDDLKSYPAAVAARESNLTGPGSKSVSKAFLFSLLVPGTGQFYTQQPGRGRIFMGTELAILAGFLGFRLYGDWKEEDYQLYAAAHADVNSDGKSRGYFEDISLYMSMEEYNRKQIQDFREDAEVYSKADFWEWDSDQSRRKFDSLYRSSSNARDNSIIMTGIGLFNHLLSAVDAARSAKLFNKKLTSNPTAIQFTFKVQPKRGSSLVMVGLKKKF